MATSGTKAWKLDVIEVIEEAYDRLGGEMTTGHELRTARRSLNILLTEWVNEGVNLWTVESASFPLLTGGGTILLPADCVDVLDVDVTRDGTDYEVERQSRSQYLRIADKDTKALPRQYYVDWQLQPMMYLWPVPDRTTDTLVVHYLSRMEDASGYRNDLDVPIRFLPALCSGLTWHLSFKRQVVSPLERDALEMRYRNELELAKGGEGAGESLFIRPGGTR